MTKKIDTSELIPEEEAALGRSYIARMQRDGGGAQLARLNRGAYKAWYNYLFTLLIGRFEWEGLPPEIDPRFVEYALATRGVGGFFAMKNGTAQWAFCPATPLGNLNMYYNPNKVMLQPVNGGVPWYRHAYYWIRGDVMYEPNAVLCWDNIARVSLIPVVQYYARRLAHLDRTVDVNLMAQQTPFILSTTKDGERDAKNLALQITGHANVIVTSDRLAEQLSTQVLNVQAPYVADKLMVDQIKMLNNYYSMIGIDNTNTEKRERMIDAEATSNNEQIMLIRQSAQRCRDEFCIKVAQLTGGQYEPVARYAAPYRLDGSVDMSGGAA